MTIEELIDAPPATATDAQLDTWLREHWPYTRPTKSVTVVAAQMDRLLEDIPLPPSGPPPRAKLLRKT